MSDYNPKVELDTVRAILSTSESYFQDGSLEGARQGIRSLKEAKARLEALIGHIRGGDH